MTNPTRDALAEQEGAHPIWRAIEAWLLVTMAGTPAPNEAEAVNEEIRRFALGQGLDPRQEPKYTVNGSAIVNRASGEAIPADEPVFIFRARDKWAAGVLGDYAAFVNDPVHRAAVGERFIQFGEWADAHPERMKEPDTASQPTEPAQPQPKTLDDPRLQDLFSCAIDGALTSGYQCVAPPPAGHWLERWWNRGRAVAEAEPAQQPADDDALTAVLIQRDMYHDIADELAERIAKITGAEIGEHSSINGPWQNAMAAADEYLDAQQPEAPAGAVWIEDARKLVIDLYRDTQKLSGSQNAADKLLELLGAAALPPHPQQQAGAVKRWPFVETPGEFTQRLSDALDHFELLGAVRHVLIENPPTLAAMDVAYAAPTHAQAEQPHPPLRDCSCAACVAYFDEDCQGRALNAVVYGTSHPEAWSTEKEAK